MRSPSAPAGYDAAASLPANCDTCTAPRKSQRPGRRPNAARESGSRAKSGAWARNLPSDARNTPARKRQKLFRKLPRISKRYPARHLIGRPMRSGHPLSCSSGAKIANASAAVNPGSSVQRSTPRAPITLSRTVAQSGPKDGPHSVHGAFETKRAANLTRFNAFSQQRVT